MIGSEVWTRGAWRRERRLSLYFLIRETMTARGGIGARGGWKAGRRAERVSVSRNMFWGLIYARPDPTDAKMQGYSRPVQGPKNDRPYGCAAPPICAAAAQRPVMSRYAEPTPPTGTRIC